MWGRKKKHRVRNTLPETKILAPEKGWLEDFFVSFWGPAYFQVRTVCFWGG